MADAGRRNSSLTFDRAFPVGHGVSPAVGAWLRDQGHDALHLHEEGLDRLADPEIFVKAAAEKRTIVTCDPDFAEMVALTGSAHVSIVLLRLTSLRPQRAIVRLARVLIKSGGALDAGAIIVVEDARHRVRGLPIPR